MTQSAQAKTRPHNKHAGNYPSDIFGEVFTSPHEKRAHGINKYQRHNDDYAIFRRDLQVSLELIHFRHSYERGVLVQFLPNILLVSMQGGGEVIQT